MNLFLDLAAFSGRRVIFACDEDDEYDAPLPDMTTLGGTEGVLRVLASMNYRVLEQRFPLRAYVVIRAAETIPDEPPVFETLVIPGQPAVPARGAVSE